MWRNLLLTFIVFGLCVGILYVTLFQLDPLGEQKFVAYLSLSAALLFGLTSLFTLVFFFGAEIISGHKLGNRSFLIAVRRALLVGLLVLTLVGLQFLRLLGLPEAILLTIFFALIEWIFLTGKHY